jgi:hypothetical protein
VAAKTQESSVNHTTRLYGVLEAICIYRRDLHNTPGSRREYSNPWRKAPSSFSHQRNFIIGHCRGLRERLRGTQVIDAWSKIGGDFIAAHCGPVALREGILYVRVLQAALHYELEQISKSEILRKLKQHFGGKTIRDVRFRVG